MRSETQGLCLTERRGATQAVRDSTQHSKLRSRAPLSCAVGRQTDLVPHLKDAGTFDTLSCQFAFHYCFASEARARCALRNVAAILRPGGHFIGEYHSKAERSRTN
jgi:SAM-dependent methyltransferase